METWAALHTWALALVCSLISSSAFPCCIIGAHVKPRETMKGQFNSEDPKSGSCAAGRSASAIPAAALQHQAQELQANPWQWQAQHQQLQKLLPGAAPQFRCSKGKQQGQLLQASP